MITINDKTEAQYGIIASRRELQPPECNPVSFWVPGALAPNYVRHEPATHKLIERIVIRGASSSDADAKMIKLIEACKSCIATYSDQPGLTYSMILSSVTRDGAGGYLRVLTMEFAAIIYGNKVTESIANGTNTITITGAQRTDLQYTIVTTGAATVKLNDITVTASAAEIIVVAADNCDLSKSDLVEFPQANPGNYEVIAIVPDAATVTLSYKPRW